LYWSHLLLHLPEPPLRCNQHALPQCSDYIATSNLAIM
jgi:hypothetical protein